MIVTAIVIAGIILIIRDVMHTKSTPVEKPRAASYPHAVPVTPAQSDPVPCNNISSGVMYTLRRR